MGKKKLKEPEITNSSTTQNDVDSAPPPSSSVFSTLFGGIHAGNDAVAGLFSDNNPFKRKPQSSAETPGDNAVDAKSELAELKKKRRSKENEDKTNFDDDHGLLQEEGTQLEKKKKSKKQLKIGKADKDNEGEDNLGNESSPALRKEEKSDGLNKIKRKRDDIERVYEAKMYGGAPASDEELQKQGSGVGKKKKKVDDEADTVVPKEGFDDESKLSRTVFVGNLPVQMKKKLLLKEFNKFGEIESVRIRSVPLMDTKKPVKGAIMQKQINEKADSVHGYIVFKTEQSADASLSHNMAVVGGNHIRVDRACPPRKKLNGESAAALYDNKRTVFVGNLPFDVKDEELYQLFSGINGLESSVEAVRVIRQPRVGMGKGIAYVLFKTREAANLAIRKRNLRIHDRELRLSHAKQDSTPSKRNDSRNNAPPRTDGAHKPITKTSMSYQGLRANKSNNPKRFHPKSNNGQMKFNAHKEETPKVRTSKRPAVAARRSKPENKAGGPPSHTGAKRKMDRTTEKHKKFKKFRK